MCCNGRYSCICLFSIIWTLIQSCIHISGAIYGYYVYNCKFKPTHVISSIFYVSYFYQSKCGTLKPLDTKTFHIWDLIISPEDKEVLSNFYNDLIQYNDHIENVDVENRVKTIMVSAFILDCIWIISTVALGMGLLCRIKGRWCYLFYAPYIAFTFIELLLDVVTSTIFSMDIPQTNNITNWLHFMRIENFDAEKYTTNHNIDFYLNLPSIVLTCFSSRFILVWFINLICFFLVLKATIVTSRQRFEDNLSDSLVPERRKKTSEARIKTWQTFYGGIESTSSEDSIVNTPQPENISPIGRIPQERNEHLGKRPRNLRFSESDVGRVIPGQRPWSYTRSPIPRRNNSDLK